MCLYYVQRRAYEKAVAGISTWFPIELFSDRSDRGLSPPELARDSWRKQMPLVSTVNTHTKSSVGDKSQRESKLSTPNQSAVLGSWTILLKSTTH